METHAASPSSFVTYLLPLHPQTSSRMSRSSRKRTRSRIETEDVIIPAKGQALMKSYTLISGPNKKLRTEVAVTQVSRPVALPKQPEPSKQLPKAVPGESPKKAHKRFSELLDDLASQIPTFIDSYLHFLSADQEGTHQDSCQKRFRRDFGQSTGKCDGEGTERLWAEMNQWAPSLSEMSFGRHHDIVDDNISDWNLRKVLGMASYLVDRAILACENRAKFIKEFKGVTSNTPASLITTWRSLDTTPQLTEDGKRYRSVYFADEHKLPNQTELRESIRREEEEEMSLISPVEDEEQSATSLLALFDGLEFALQLEQLQVNTQRQAARYIAEPTPTHGDKLEQMRSTLRSKLALWTTTASRILPMTASRYPSNLAKPEDVSLHLPSCYPLGEHRTLGLVSAGQLEKKIREVKAYQTIGKIKAGIVKKSANLTVRHQHIVGQRAATRATNVINAQVKIIEKYANDYQRIRDSLLALGMPGDHPALRELRREDCQSKCMFSNEVRVSKHQKQGKRINDKELSWIWTVGTKHENHGDQWQIETQRVHWFLARAQKDRWIEEVEIIQEEMRRLIRYFNFYQEMWAHMATTHENRPHIASYCTATSVTYQQLKEDCVERFPDEIRTDLNFIVLGETIDSDISVVEV
ncbi:hypothetical protein M422DRAFT_268065 [Sphaerobolus stellatus SS14]|uniref:Uncharacterized protein n=1 Tax=Sphaerobolus stellatus (strain SS14) TaxID=990650 RepID=A0A0C9UZ99_SPHS4|nr:hypothetical protein M422DRAFT_268065 [Sphaerobolus stellatus SS14]